MAIEFLSSEWLHAFKNKLNLDERYARIAKNWEGDFAFRIEADETFPQERMLYMDLWHGKCRNAFLIDQENNKNTKPAYILSATYNIFLRILEGKLDPMQAMLSRKLKVSGSMAYMMRNIPVVLDFVRCAKETTQQIKTNN
ncbi:MAG TPA: hypothetical protein G4N95_02565 [Anaerolineae bacterium]|nr:hypothetical protein [Anaerolineae bacterium]